MEKRSSPLFRSLRSLVTRESKTLLAALLCVGLIYAFVEIMDEVLEGETQTIDEWVVTAFRQPDDPSLPVGPAWLREAMIDATALGSPLVLGLVTFAAVGYLILAHRRRLALLTLLAVVSGWLVNAAAKYAVGRVRPSVVPHLREVITPSFPSGHSMMSAIVFTTLGILIARSLPKQRLRAYSLAWGILLPVLVGLSRVYLGVHYPTDVLAGWAAGLAWGLIWFLLARWIDRPSIPSSSHAP